MISLIGSRKESPIWNLEEIVMSPQEIAEQERLEAIKRSKKFESPIKTEPIMTPSQPVPPIVVNPSQTTLPYWTIPNVTYRGVIGNVDIQKILLDNGASKEQSEWVKYSVKEEESTLQSEFER